jgi:hypothetical protein
MNGIKGTAAGLAICAAVVAATPLATQAAQAHKGVKPQKTSTTAKAQKNSISILLGSLQALSATSATVTRGTTSTTVALSANTRYVAHSQAAAIGGLKQGEQVAVIVRTGKTGPEAAQLIYDTVPFGVAQRYSGTVAASTSTSLTLNLTATTSVTLQLNASTRYRVNGVSVTTAPGFLANAAVTVEAEYLTTGATVARLVAIGTAPKAADVARVNGKLAGISGNTLTVTLKGGTTVSVTLTPTTLFYVNNALVTTLPALTSTATVQVRATRATDGTLTALTVKVRAKTK